MTDKREEWRRKAEISRERMRRIDPRRPSLPENKAPMPPLTLDEMLTSVHRALDRLTGQAEVDDGRK